MAEETETLWSSLLRESSKLKKVPQAACVVVGDTGIGKSKLVDNICSNNKSSNQANHDSNNLKTEIVSYNYLDYEEYESDIVAKIHLWTIGLQAFDKAFEVLVSPKKTERLAIIIALDLTKDDIIDTLKYWLRKSSWYSKVFHSESYKETSAKLKSSQSYYIQNIKSNKGAALQQPDNVQVDNENVGIPIIVVGCKSDILKLDDVASSRKAKEIQSQLRAICLQTKSALVYTSATKNINCQKLSKYIMHRLYHDVIPFVDLGIEDGIDNVFIPTGFDTKDLISIATGVSLNNIQHVDLDKPISSDEDNQRKIALFSKQLENIPSNQIVDIESEEEWILGLQSFINQVTASGATTTGNTVAAVSTNAPAAANPAATKRASVRAPVALEEKQDVDDFFKSLLKK